MMVIKDMRCNTNANAIFCLIFVFAFATLIKHAFCLTLLTITHFQSTEKSDVHCDGSLSSVIAVGLKVVLQKLMHHDMDTVVTMLTNMVGYVTSASFRSSFVTSHGKCPVMW